MSVERALRTLQAVARENVEHGHPSEHRTFRMHVRQPTFVDHQVDAAEALKRELAADPRFEHMKDRDVDEAAWEFATTAHRDREHSHVQAFIERHEEEPLRVVCWFPIEGITLPRSVELAGTTLVPAEEIDLPELVEQLAETPMAPTIHTAIGVPCVGTNGRKMMGRARGVAEHALRILRAGLSDKSMVAIDYQLRFRLGTVYWFSGGGGAFGSPADAILKLDIPEDLLAAALSDPIAALPARGGTRVEQAARRALQWFEDAQLATDRLNKTLFMFFALEALLGDDSEGLKAEGLALRRAVLSQRETGHFSDPERIYSLYEDVRSGAVHGSARPNVSEDTARTLSEDVRKAISQLLEFARREGFTSRGKLLKALDEDPVRTRIKETFLPLNETAEGDSLLFAAAHRLGIDLESGSWVRLVHFLHGCWEWLPEGVQQRAERVAKWSGRELRKRR